MPFSITDMRSQLQFGGALPTLFQVQIRNPVDGLGDLKVPFMAKASTLPPSNLGTREVPYMGRKIKLAGDRVFEEWTVTVINDEDFLIKNALESWMSSINGHETNLASFDSANPNNYKSQAQIIQYSKTGVPIREYNFNGLFPTAVEAIEMNWETNDTIEEFAVTFQYDWWNISGGITGNGGT